MPDKCCSSVAYAHTFKEIFMWLGYNKLGIPKQHLTSIQTEYMSIVHVQSIGTKASKFISSYIKN